ncbi:stalk domain-containing protein [Paenibacillus sp. NPDC056579]|uniref:stalk domain-containing protein n=1 Tax=Paenibacillus sp. NPDC056579 TaxID=3345871 RepID=UPI0036AFCABA
MLRFIASSLKARTLISTVAAASLIMPSAAGAVSVTHQHLQLFADQSEVYVNGQQAEVDEPASLINDQFYIPVRWLADTLKLDLSWVKDTQTVQLITSKAFIEFQSSQNAIKVNGTPVSFDSAAVIRNDRLLVSLSWLAQYIDMDYELSPDKKSIEIRYIGTPGATYRESLLVKDDAQPNSRPVALFAFGKPEYRLGEKVEYVDLSYDPDAEGLPVYEWTGNENAFYKPGTYPVTLKVKDGNGNVSAPFTRTVTIVDEPYLSQEQYPYYYGPAGKVFPAESEWLEQTVGKDRKVPVIVRQQTERPLLFGRSSEPVKELGFLYQEKVKGKARLFPQFTNGTGSAVQFAIVIQNQQEKEVKVTTTRKSEQVPSIYNSVRGDKIAEDFLGSDPVEDVLTVPPKSTVYYKVSPQAASGQSFQGMYDIETDGEVLVSYGMMKPDEPAYKLGSYRFTNQQPGQNGTYPVSEIAWTVDSRALVSPTKAGIGDETVEPVIKGADSVLKQEASAAGNAGMHYSIRLYAGKNTAIALHPRDGYFQGAVRVNGQFISLPASGMTSHEAVILYRTGVKEEDVSIEILPAGTTQLPVDLVLYPLTKK